MRGDRNNKIQLHFAHAIRAELLHERPGTLKIVCWVRQVRKMQRLWNDSGEMHASLHLVLHEWRSCTLYKAAIGSTGGAAAALAAILASVSSKYRV